MPEQTDLAVALELADLADRITLPYFESQSFESHLKGDSTPVTEADTACEAALRERLAELRPGDGIIGEEFGATGGRERSWIIDPIDGTANFMRRVPIWGTLIALAVDGKPTVSVVSAPALARRWWAAPEVGSWTSEISGAKRRLEVSKVASLGEASLSYNSIQQWDRAGLLEPLVALSRQVWRTRAFGDFYSYMLLAEGAIDIVGEHDLKLHDIAALVPIVELAGGSISDLTGPLSNESSSVLATNGLLHEAVRAQLTTFEPQRF